MRRQALVIGGSGGVGSEICCLLGQSGYDVRLTYHGDAVRAEAAAEATHALGAQVAVHRVDAGEAASVAALAEEVGVLDLLVYAAGPLVPQLHLSGVSPELMRDHLIADTLGFYRILHAVLPALRESRGSIVAVLSAAEVRYATRDALSVVPKAGVHAILRAIAKEEGRFGIRANGVALGIIEAGSHTALRERGDIDPGYMEAAVANTPLRRNGTARDVAEAVVWLGSDKAGFVTGEVIHVDGGYHI